MMEWMKEQIEFHVICYSYEYTKSSLFIGIDLIIRLNELFLPLGILIDSPPNSRVIVRFNLLEFIVFWSFNSKQSSCSQDSYTANNNPI